MGAQLEGRMEVPPYISHLKPGLPLTAKDGYFYYLRSKES